MTFRSSVLAGILALIAALGVLYATHFSPREPKNIATFAGVSLTLEFATTPEARQKGLSGRPVVPEGYGMLFAFAQPGRHGFWMKETVVPLDIFWLDTKGQVVSIAQEVATSTFPHVFYPAAPAQYVLETAAGFARTHGVATGTQLELKNFPIVSQ